MGIFSMPSEDKNKNITFLRVWVETARSENALFSVVGQYVYRNIKRSYTNAITTDEQEEEEELTDEGELTTDEGDWESE